MLGKEIKSGTRIPVLAELRNIENQTLEEYLCTRFCLLLGIQNDSEIFEGFATQGKISFFLDGFDEIDPNIVQRVTQQIEDLSYKFGKCRIVVTSRPDSECRHLTKFTSLKIRPLSEADLEPFYKKITRDAEFTSRLLAAVRVSPIKIKELVTTPLLATLLAISYRAAQRIPLDFSEFYEELFQILLIRHDASKLGWRRQRKTKLNDKEIEQIFEAFCFATRKNKTASIDREIAIDLARESISECQFQVDPQHFIEDIKKITCLMLDEGKRISFVHISVQEFFASRYIKTRPEPVAATFYKQLAAGKWKEWPEEILFLRQIDTHRATKYFLIPDIESTLSDVFGSDEAFSDKSFIRYLEGLNVSRKNVDRDGIVERQFSVRRSRKTDTQHYRHLDSLAYDSLFSREYPNSRNWTSGFNEDPSSSIRSYHQIAMDRGSIVVDTLRTSITNAVKSLVTDRDNWKNALSHAEVHRSFMDIG